MYVYNINIYSIKYIKFYYNAQFPDAKYMKVCKTM